MRHMLRIGLNTLLCLLFFCSQAFAAEKATFLILPFSVQGPQGFAYLERSVPQMLTSRLYVKDMVEPAIQDLPSGQKAVTDEATADKLRSNYKASHVIWGTVTVIGQDCSIDVRVKDNKGKTWHFSGESPANQFIAAIKVVSDQINADVFKHSPATAAKGKGGKAPMHPDLVRNEATSKDVYLNPQFRYAGDSNEDDTRMRSQTLPFVSVGMEVCDADGDGKNEVFILSDNKLYAYDFSDGKLTPAGEFQFPRTAKSLSIRSWKNSAGKTLLIVNIIDADNRPISSILRYGNKQFTEEAKNLRYFLNVVKLPPQYTPILIGQRSQKPNMFYGPVTEMIKSGQNYVQGAKLDLPSDANAFNFTYMPGRRGEPGSDKIIVLSDAENLRVYSLKKSRQAQTEETYSGSAVGLEMPTEMAGLGEDTVTIKGVYYIPLRMLAVDLEQDGKYELLVNRPLSTAAKIFNRYRFYPQSELQSLYWDGLGLNLQWKTRRIKGSVADFALADANNDGTLDLVACINTHPGAIGAKARKTLIMLYSLDLSSTTGVRPHISED